MKTISETGTELTAGNKRLEEAAEDAAKHEVRQHKLTQANNPCPEVSQQ